MKPAATFHDVRERRAGGSVFEVEQWRMTGGRLYEKVTSEEETRVRVAAGGKGLDMTGNTVRPLRPAALRQWMREVRMAPLNFEAHAAEMGVVSTVEGDIERLEAVDERLVLERDARSGVPRRITDLRLKQSVVFDQPRDAQGRHVPRLEIRYRLDREEWRDRILSVEFDAPIPADVHRLWDALAAGRSS